MTERERENEILKYQLRDLSRQFTIVLERYCKYIDDTESLLKFHERNSETLAKEIDQERVIG